MENPERSPQQLLAVQTWIAHPPPWRIEHDWTVEVHAADGHIVAKCSSIEEAESVIDWAKEMNQILDDIFVDGPPNYPDEPKND